MKTLVSFLFIFMFINSRSTAYSSPDIHSTIYEEQQPGIDQLNRIDSYWVYVGRYSPAKKVWLNKNFDVEDIPQAGSEIRSLTAVTKRKDYPVKDNNYRISSAVGVLKSGETVKISEVKAMVGDNYWIKIDM